MSRQFNTGPFDMDMDMGLFSRQPTCDRGSMIGMPSMYKRGMVDNSSVDSCPGYCYQGGYDGRQPTRPLSSSARVTQRPMQGSDWMQEWDQEWSPRSTTRTRRQPIQLSMQMTGQRQQRIPIQQQMMGQRQQQMPMQRRQQQQIYIDDADIPSSTTINTTGAYDLDPMYSSQDEPVVSNSTRPSRDPRAPRTAGKQQMQQRPNGARDVYPSDTTRKNVSWSDSMPNGSYYKMQDDSDMYPIDDCASCPYTADSQSDRRQMYR